MWVVLIDFLILHVETKNIYTDMKRYLLVLGLTCVLSEVNAQVVFSEDFSGGVMPSGFVLINKDGKTPATSVNYVTNAWVVRNESSSNTNKVAVSTSWYSPAGASDDWMITPPITITSNCALKWRARAVDPSYPDGYEVRICTTAHPTLTVDTTTANFSTVLFSVAAENGSWTDRGVNLSTYNGQTVRIAFRNNSNDMFLLQVDDIQVVQLPSYDAGITAINNYRYYEQGNITLNATLKNYGLQNINTIQVHWTYDGTNINTATLSSLNVAPFASYTFNHSVPLIASGSNKYPIKMWTSTINGNPDANASNDTSSWNLYSVSAKPAKKTVVEEATGAWCQFCPDGAVKLQAILDSNPNAIGISIHDGDGMANPQTDSINVNYISGFPSGLIDRFKFLNQSDVELSRTLWSSYTTTRGNMPVPFGITMSHTYNTNTRELSVQLDATSFINANDRNYRFNLVLVQDSMSGIGTGWDQVNYYNTQAGHPYYQAGNPIVGYQHRHVGRWWVGGVFGEPNSFPMNITDGGTYSKTYTLTLPNDYDENRVYLVGMIQEFTGNVNERPILNAEEQKLSFTTSRTALNTHTQPLQVFPNPAQDMATLIFSMNEKDLVNIQVLDLTGKKVFEQQQEFLKGTHEITLPLQNLSNGTYLVRVFTKDTATSTKLTIQK